MNNSIAAQRCSEFDSRNDKKNSVQDDTWIYFKSGAKREVNVWGALISPPTDDYERLSNVLQFYQLRHAKLVTAFHDLKESLLSQTGGDAGTDANIKRLKALKAEVAAAAEDLEEAQAALSRTDRAKAMQGHKDSQAEQRSRIAQHRSVVSAIRLAPDDPEEE